MYKKITIVIVLVLMLLLASCSGSDNSSKTGVPSNSSINSSDNSDNIEISDNTASTDTKVEEIFEDFGEGKPAKMSGNSNKEFTLAMEEGGYYLRMKTKDLYNGLNSVDVKSPESGISIGLYSSYGSGKDEDGWYVYERLEHWYSSGDTIFVVEAEGPYIIEIYKLPMSSGYKDLPINIKGSGTKTIGPISAEGSITIKAKTADAKQAGFLIEVVDGTTGQMSNIAYINIDKETKEAINEVDITETVELTGTGVYFISVNSNNACEWELEISN